MAKMKSFCPRFKEETFKKTVVICFSFIKEKSKIKLKSKIELFSITYKLVYDHPYLSIFYK